MPTTVVNIYKEECDTYIGRGGKGQSGYFGNPFRNGTREENVAKFRVYFYQQIKEDPEYKARIHRLQGQSLGCFCKPKNACHGDIIAEYLNDLPHIYPVKLAVIGSRSFRDYPFLKNILKWYDISMVVSGGAEGADTLARKYAVEQDIKLKEFKPDWNKYGKSAGFRRNDQIVQEADEIVAFWDGNSRGTKHSINLAEEQGKPVYIYWPKAPASDIPHDDFSHLGV